MLSITNIKRLKTFIATRGPNRVRPGTVLILVVVLLVLLALIGTAFVSTARIDRVASGQNISNTEIELLLQGAQSQVYGTVINHLFGNLQFRPPGVNNGYSSSVGYWATDSYLAARHPVRVSDFSGGTTTAGTSPIVWPTLTWPLDGSTSCDDPTNSSPINLNQASPVRPQFSPTSITTSSGVYPALQMVNPQTGANIGSPFIAASASGDGIGDAVLRKLPMAPMNGVSYYVAARVIDNNSALNVNTAFGPEGDGSYPTWFPGSIDLQDILVRNGGGSFDEMDAPDSSSTIGGINAWRFNNIQSLGGLGAMTPEDDAILQVGGPYLRSDFTYLTLNDALWNNVGRRVDNPAYLPSTVWNNTGAGNPNSLGIFPNPRYHAFDISDSIGLATHFCLFPTTNLSNVEARLPYSAGAGALVGINNRQTNPYAPGSYQQWFTDNFDYSHNLSWTNPTSGNSLNANNYPTRSLLVARNPVSNGIEAHDMTGLPRCITGIGTVALVNPGAASAPGPVSCTMTSYPDYINYGDTTTWQEPCKASLNTDSVMELWRAFWNVMCDDVNPVNPPSYTTQNPTTGINTGYQGIYGNVIRDPRNTMTAVASGDMFTTSNMLLLRSAIAAANACNMRDGMCNGMATSNSAFDFWNHNADFAPRTNPPVPPGPDYGYYITEQFNINLQSNTNNTNPNLVTVFGYRPQPFITEVYINTNTGTTDANYTTLTTKAKNTTGYMAVELYNPYPFAIDISSCNMEFMTRTGGATGTAGNMWLGNVCNRPLPINVNFPNTNPFTQGGNGTNMVTPLASNFLIPAHGWLVMENYDSPGTAGLAKYRPSDVTRATGWPAQGAVPNVLVNGQNVLNVCYCPMIQYVYSQTSADQRTGIANVGSVEMVLTRPREAIFTGGTLKFANIVDSVAQANDIPMDQLDLTSTVLAPSAAATTYYAVHYVRPTPANVDGTAAVGTPDPAAWQFVYPGRYDPSATAFTWNQVNGSGFREEGIQMMAIPASQTPAPNWSLTPIMLGKPSPNASYPSAYVQFGGPTTGPGSAVVPTPFIGGATAHTFRNPIQLPNMGCVGINQPLGTTSGNQFPFGAYGRTGDMLNVPFIGAYQVLNPSVTPGASSNKGIVEINSITKDAALADDLRDPLTGSPATTPYLFQNIGRFCPCGNPTATGSTLGDYQDPANASTTVSAYRYQFAMRLFNYFSAQQNPNADYTPNVSIDRDWLVGAEDLQSNADQAANVYPGTSPAGETFKSNNNTSSIAVPNSNGEQISNGNGGASSTAGSANPRVTASLDSGGDQYHDWYNGETTTGSDGYVNVNTASWKVLACVPLVPNYNAASNVAAGTTNWKATENLAKAIVYFRDIDDGSGSGHGHGPFKSLFELNMVPGFATALTTAGLPANTPPNFSLGDYFSDPNRTGASACPLVNNMSNNYRTLNDWETTTLMVNRVSNLLTLRSDTFTVYLQVQGWTNAGTPNAQMVAQRRLAFILDRSSTIGLSQAVINLMNIANPPANANQPYTAITPNPSALTFTVPSN